MGLKNYIDSIAVTSINSSTLTGSYQAINSSGVEHSLHSLEIVNDSNKTVTISLDGSTDHDVVLAGFVLSIITPSPLLNAWRKGTVVYAKGTAGTGTIYVTGKYIAT